MHQNRQMAGQAQQSDTLKWPQVDHLSHDRGPGRGRALRNEKFDVESGAYVDIDFEAKLDFARWLGLMKSGWGSV